MTSTEVAESRTASASLGPSGIRFDQIDALRGLAALLVVFHHCCGHVGGGSWWRVSLFGHVMYPSHIFYHGYIGVDLFLVLSGFCLAWPVLVRPDKPFKLGVYARRRFARIYPPYIIMFLLLCLGGWACRKSGLPQLEHLGFAQPLTGFRFLGSLSLQMTNLNPAFWTLCLEARWYILFPIVVLMARKYPVWPILFAAAIASALTPYTEHGPAKLLIYLPAFIAGVLAAQIHAILVQNTQSTVGTLRTWCYGLGFLTFLLACIIWLPKPDIFGRGTIREVFLTTGLFFCLLMLALQHKSALPLPLRGLQKIGIFSYSLYLVHVPIIELGAAIYRPSHYANSIQLFYWLCIFVPIIVLLSYLFFLVAEKPFLAGSPSGAVALLWWKRQRAEPRSAMTEESISLETKR